MLSGGTFTLRSVGFAFNEVCVSLLDRGGPCPALFTAVRVGLSALVTTLLLTGAATPAGCGGSGAARRSRPTSRHMAWRALWLLVPMGAVSDVQSLPPDALVHVRDTRAITRSMAVLLVATAGDNPLGDRAASRAGLFAAFGMTAGGWRRSRGSRTAHADDRE